MTTAMVEVQNAVAEFDKVAAGIAALEAQYGKVVFDVTTTKGMDEAKKARAAVREPRYEIERVRKAAKAPILKLGKDLDSRAAAITAQILAIENPIDEQIAAEEDRKEHEKQARIDAEEKRVRGLQERIAYLRGNQSLTSLSPPELLADHISDLEKEQVDASFQEFQQQAADAKAAGLARLRDLHTAAVSRVENEQRIAAERAELAKLRAEQIERERVEKARLADEERAAKAQRDAEAARQAEALRIQREADEAEAAKRRAELKAEEDRLSAERAELERRQAEQRREQEEAERVKREQARLASIKKPPDAEILGVLAAHYGVPASKVVEWVLAIDFSAVKAA